MCVYTHIYIWHIVRINVKCEYVNSQPMLDICVLMAARGMEGTQYLTLLITEDIVGSGVQQFLKPNLTLILTFGRRNIYISQTVVRPI